MAAPPACKTDRNLGTEIANCRKASDRLSQAPGQRSVVCSWGRNRGLPGHKSKTTMNQRTTTKYKASILNRPESGYKQLRVPMRLFSASCITTASWHLSNTHMSPKQKTMNQNAQILLLENGQFESFWAWQGDGPCIRLGRIRSGGAGAPPSILNRPESGYK